VPRTKGVSFINVHAFGIQRAGDSGWQRVLGELTEADREELSTIVAVGWYDLGLYARLIRSVDRVLGAGNLVLLRELGRFEADRDLTTVHRLFIRMASPAWVIEKTMEYWRRFHDTGQWKVQRESSHAVNGTLLGWGVVDEALCIELMGYMPRVVELAGARSAQIAHPSCRGRGDQSCDFRLSWDGG
jgi:hypothetical protein